LLMSLTNPCIEYSCCRDSSLYAAYKLLSWQYQYSQTQCRTAHHRLLTLPDAYASVRPWHRSGTEPASQVDIPCVKPMMASQIAVHSVCNRACLRHRTHTKGTSTASEVDLHCCGFWIKHHVPEDLHTKHVQPAAGHFKLGRKHERLFCNLPLVSDATETTQQASRC